jgi:hypothetical protein
MEQQTDAPVRRSPLPSAGEIDEWINQHLAEFDEQRRRNHQNGSTAAAPASSSNGRQSS